jgi:hypothetical protein
MFNSGSTSTWAGGDFTYDGVVDVLDAADFVGVGLYNTGTYLPSGGAPLASSTAFDPLSPFDAAFAAMAFDQQPKPLKKSVFAAR